MTQLSPEWELAKNITGYLSTTLLALLYIPQVIIVYWKKDPHGLSMVFLSIGYLLTIDTIIYGAILKEWPLIIANIIAFVCMGFLMVAKCIWRKKPTVDEIDVEK